MTNRKLAYIVKDQNPLVLADNEMVEHACRLMWERRAGSVLVVDTEDRLSGIFTGRDAVRLLAQGADAGDRSCARDDAESGDNCAQETRHRRPASHERWRLPPSSRN